MMQCPVDAPPWFTDPRTGICGPGDIAQCNMVFQARLATLAGGATGTLTFDVSTSNFNRFQPVGLKFSAVLLTLTASEGIGGVMATEIDFAGTNYLLDVTGLSLTTFGVDGENALSIFHMPVLKPSAQDVTVAVTNVTSAVTVQLFGWMYGFADR